MKRTIFTLVSILLAGTFLLTACGGAETPVSTEPMVTEPPTSEPEVPTLTMWFSVDYKPAWEAIIPMFEEEYGVDVIDKYPGSDYTMIQSSFPVGKGPDIAEFPADVMGTLVEGGLIAPIDMGNLVDSFIPGAIIGSSYKGKVYGFPVEAGNIALFWNTDILDIAPTTWEEFETMCAEVIAAGVEHCLLLPPDMFHFQPILTSFGGYGFGYNWDGSSNPLDVGLDSPGSLGAVQWLDRMVKAGYISGVSWETVASLFTGGRAAMFITGSWNLQAIRDSGMPYRISAIPSGPYPAAPFLGIRCIGINAFSENQALAQAFLTEFLATEEVMLAFFNARNTPIAFLPALEQITDPDTLGMAEAGMYAFPMPTIPEQALFWGPANNALTLVLNQQQDPVEAFRVGAEQLRTLIVEQDQ
ncbi:MAG: extracellular solute-binding protein [Chloroflexi bacterium]|nr:extracellular solute-binding protein [Chloroflexota bacterium]